MHDAAGEDHLVLRAGQRHRQVGPRREVVGDGVAPGEVAPQAAVGIVLVEAGEVTKQELATEFADIYKTNWPWPINALDEWTFLVKLPPEIDVVQVAGYPCFGLKKENVVVNVEVWKGRIEAEEDLQETWIKIRKLNPQVV